MNIRVLSIRKHKTVSFINGYCSEFGNQQYMIDNCVLSNIKCGDLINVDYIDTLNMKGNPVKKIIDIKELISCNDFESFKGVNSEITDQKYKNYLGARNCGIQLELFKLKREIIIKLRDMLNNLNFMDVSNLLNTVEFYKNGSGIIDAQIMDRDDNSPKYLRTTLEVQLKQIAGITLQSVYAIDKVYRNMGEDSSHINEFLMLEFISLSLTLDEIINFVSKIDNSIQEIAQNYGILNSEEKLNIIDYNDIIKSSVSFEQIKKELKNVLILNFPCNSPFIKKDEIDNLRKEIRWYVNGHWISHFYNDENNINNINEALNEQNLLSQKDNVNPLNYFKWGLPSTTSFGLSIDRWLQMMLNQENINSIANPLSLDYKKNLVKVKKI